MNLTADDLQAIKGIVDTAIDVSLQQTALGFSEVHEKIDAIGGDVASLKSDVAVLKSDVAVLKSDVAVLKSDVAVLKSDVNDLQSKVSNIEDTVGRIEMVQRAEVSRADQHGQDIAYLKQRLVGS